MGVSGASGTPYAASVLRALLAAGESVDLVVSRASRLTLLDETGLSFRDAHWQDDLRVWLARGADGKPGTFDAFEGRLDAVRHWSAGDLAAGPSSGSYPSKGMLIVPASTACVAGVALGLSKDLLQRAASVTLKEGRKLVVAVRETPLSGQTLRHLVSWTTRAPPCCPPRRLFYAGPRTSRTWWTSSPGGCWTRRASNTGCTAGGRANSAAASGRPERPRPRARTTSARTTRTRTTRTRMT